MNTLRTITTALLLVVATACAVAQNSIDRMMDNYSSRGTSRFTSAVEREPKTRKVLKVVNVLELRHDGVGEFVDAFRREAATGDFTERRTEDGLTLMLVVRGKRQNRIYMMRRRRCRYGRPPFRPQKVTFQTLKRRFSHCERRRFAYALIINALRAGERRRQNST